MTTYMLYLFFQFVDFIAHVFGIRLLVSVLRLRLWLRLWLGLRLWLRLGLLGNRRTRRPPVRKQISIETGAVKINRQVEFIRSWLLSAYLERKCVTY